VLLDQALPEGTNLFAATEDALALDYLIHIWGLRPDLAVVSSEEAGVRLRGGESVYSTYEVAPVLLRELPPDLSVVRAGAGADWLALSLQPLPPGEAAHALEQELVPGVVLEGYSVQAAPDGAPVTVRGSEAGDGADVTLAWELRRAWPEGLGISLRPTQGGAFVPDPQGEGGAILQVDATAPLRGLAAGAAAGEAPAEAPAEAAGAAGGGAATEAAEETAGGAATEATDDAGGGAPTEAAATETVGEALRLADSYRIPLPPGADGITLIVYERTPEGFRNLLQLPLDLAGMQDRP
jgi:hypothetical protein